MDPLPVTATTEKFDEAPPQIREMLHIRTRELAVRAGRIPQY
jgi:hypothetical protein